MIKDKYAVRQIGFERPSHSAIGYVTVESKKIMYWFSRVEIETNSDGIIYMLTDMFPGPLSNKLKAGNGYWLDDIDENDVISKFMFLDEEKTNMKIERIIINDIDDDLKKCYLIIK